MLSRKKIVDLICKMRSYGVVLYGAGNRGRIAYDVLIDSGIEIKAISDKRVLKIGEITTISIDDLLEQYCDEICIITPACGVEQETKKLNKIFSIVLDYEIINFLHTYIPEYSDDVNYIDCHPFNHYESPYPDEVSIKSFYKNNVCEITEIDFSEQEQYNFFIQTTHYMNEFIESLKDNDRYNPDNLMYPILDAARYSSIIRHNKSKRIIEIGSGFSTFAALDTNDKWCEGNVKITCIEPYPERLYSRITEKDRNTMCIISDFVQNVDISIFDELKEGDILFIDSSHIAKSGGDIPFEYFNILPRLNPGVIIHIHDILFPFDYPKEWLGRGYNEAFILRGILTCNDRYKILYFSDYMNKKYFDIVDESHKKLLGGCSIWLKKC